MSDLSPGGAHRGKHGARVMGNPWTRAQLIDALTFVHQTDALLLQAAPVQNQWYDILAATANVRLYSMAIQIAATNENLDLRLIIDGVTYNGSQNPAVAGTDYAGYVNTLWAAGSGLVLGAGIVRGACGDYEFMEGNSVQVSARKTTANGVGNLLGKVVYAVRV